jgi:hypothetical protein
MVCARVRRVGRVSTFILLVWTAVDLVDHNLSGHGAAGAPSTIAVIAVPSAPAGPSGVPHADHSFCCSHTVDVQTPFEIAVTPLLAGLAPVDSPALAFRDPSRLYHPPLA